MSPGLSSFFSQLLEIVGDKTEIENTDGLVKYVADKTKKSEAVVRKNLWDLASAGLIECVKGRNSLGRGQKIVGIKILKKELPAASPDAAPKRVCTAGLKTLERPAVAVLVDYDNARMKARDSGFSLSFAKLRDYTRRFGRVLFANVFVSIQSCRPETVNQLWQAGFEVVICPSVLKDRDEVDNKIILLAKRYTEHSDVQTVVVFSEDGDLSANTDLTHFVLDLGKKIEFVQASRLRDELAGEDEQVHPLEHSSRALQRFARVIEIGSNGSSDNVDVETVQKIEYLRAIVTVADSATNGGYKYSFRPLMDYVWRVIGSRFAHFYTMNDLQKAMSALVDAGVLAKIEARGANYYKVEYNHPFVSKMRTAQAAGRSQA